jgi:predicted transposase YbfD/YdcC
VSCFYKDALSMPRPECLRYFDTLPDPRQSWKITYPLDEILLLLLTGTLAGAETLADIAEYGKSKQPFLSTFLPFLNGVPSQYTLQRLLEALNPSAFRACLTAWMQALHHAVDGHVAIDGKCVRHAFSHTQKAIHLVSAWGSQSRCLLGQVKVSEKSNEITAIPELLELLALDGQVVTLDAMGTQHAIADHIIAKGADYVLALKGNQSSLHEDVKSFLRQQRQENFRFSPCIFRRADTLDKGHGRVEKRVCWVSEDVAWLRERHPEWHSISSICCVESLRHVGEKVQRECRYYVSSLAGVSAEQMGRYVRRHWSIENECHWVLDVVFKEDACRVQRGAENLHVVRQLAMHRLRQYCQSLEEKRLSLRRAVKRAGWDDTTMHQILTLP